MLSQSEAQDSFSFSGVTILSHADTLQAGWPASMPHHKKFTGETAADTAIAACSGS